MQIKFMRMFKYTRMISGRENTQWIDLEKVYKLDRYDDSGGFSYLIVYIQNGDILQFNKYPTNGVHSEELIAMEFIKQIEEYWKYDK